MLLGLRSYVVPPKELLSPSEIASVLLWTLLRRDWEDSEGRKEAERILLCRGHFSQTCQCLGLRVWFN
jgi:hypothetical protein